MIKGFVLNIIENDNKEAIIILEDQRSYTIPIEMLPKYIEIDDFIIIDNGKITIDPDSDDKREYILSKLQENMQ